MPVDAQAQRLLGLIAAASGGRRTSEGTVDEARLGYEMMHPVVADDGSGPVASVEDLAVPAAECELMARVYRPRAPGVVPTIVFFHGGGWVIGSLASHDGQARLLCAGTSAVVVSVAYRLAPEAPFPAPLDDCTAATRWVFDHTSELGGDVERVGLAGDSAGGNLAAAVTIRMRDAGGPSAAAQLLVYPATDASQSTASYRENAEGYFLTADTMRWFWEHYLNGAAPSAEASVIDAGDLRGLPPAVIVTAEFDPLRDEGNAYAARLGEAGVPVTLIECPGLIHGFFGMTAYVEAASEATARFLEAYRALLWNAV